MEFLPGQNVFETSKSETKILVILVISDFKIDRTRESRDLNSFSKKVRAE